MLQKTYVLSDITVPFHRYDTDTQVYLRLIDSDIHPQLGTSIQTKRCPGFPVVYPTIRERERERGGETWRVQRKKSD